MVLAELETELLLTVRQNGYFQCHEVKVSGKARIGGLYYTVGSVSTVASIQFHL